jgi:hypothetical protein
MTKNPSRFTMARALLLGGAVAAPTLLCGGSADAHGGDGGGPPAPPPITYEDIARNPATGITYRRTKSDTDALMDAIKIKPFLSIVELTAAPAKTRGAPGVALIDYDGDGDSDIFVPNGPGTPHSLYQNQFAQTGNVTFIDKAAVAGVTATSQDGTGVCYGDTDNDGDDDLLVLGRMEPARFYRNNGNGTFTDRSANAGIAQGARGYTSCAMGDIDNDGLIDVYVTTTFDWAREEAIYSDYFSFSQTDELYHNNGGNQFTDVSASSGITQLFNVPPGDGTITWAIGLVDFDQDGDTDIFMADDQGAMPPKEFAGIDRGLVHILVNDGTGHFSDVTATQGIQQATSWMGLSFGDVNCDGHMDYFATSLGDFDQEQYGVPIPTPFNSSQWYFGSEAGKFSPAPPSADGRPLSGLVATPFGWGTGMVDYDNDADTDIIFYGALDFTPFISADNPGVVLKNDGCSGVFTWDANATASSAEFVKRQTVEGTAWGDLDNDGFVDHVYASGGYAPPSIPMVGNYWHWGGPFDATAHVIPTFVAIGPFEWEWMGGQLDNGYLGIEMNSGNNGNNWAKIEVLGSKGLTPLGSVNRDGIGALVKFKPKNKSEVMQPVQGGSSYASQNSLIQNFGLGSAHRGRAEVLWPGGVKNRLYDVEEEEHVLIPEIPCDYSADWVSRNVYKACVNAALADLKHAGVITNSEGNRLRDSALRAYDDTH